MATDNLSILNLRSVFLGCLVLVLITPLDIRADVLLDQSYDAIEDEPFSNSQSLLNASQSLTQTFTAGLTGQLVQIDVQVGRTAPFPSTDLVLDILEVQNGDPILNSFGSVQIPLADIPFANTFDEGDFVAVDVSSLSIQVDAGDVFAFELTHPTDTGAFNWFTGGVDGYSGGQSYFRNPPSTDIQFSGNPDGDLGFQSWVQTIPEPSSAAPILFALTLLSQIRKTSRVQHA